MFVYRRICVHNRLWEAGSTNWAELIILSPVRQFFFSLWRWPILTHYQPGVVLNILTYTRYRISLMSSGNEQRNFSNVMFVKKNVMGNTIGEAIVRQCRALPASTSGLIACTFNLVVLLISGLDYFQDQINDNGILTSLVTMRLIQWRVF